MADASTLGSPVRPPRVLVTGFSVFPGAAINPTEKLIGVLRANPLPIDRIGAFRAEVLDVEYATVANRLSRIGREFLPDIAIHFGLARECAGFRLERVARNRHDRARPDQTGRMPSSPVVCTGPETLPSTLPNEAIAWRLEQAGLPVEWSDDAGGYLCNTVLMLSLAHACDGFCPVMAGFIHVPPLHGTVQDGEHSMEMGVLVAGACIAIASCIESWYALPA